MSRTRWRFPRGSAVPSRHLYEKSSRACPTRSSDMSVSSLPRSAYSVAACEPLCWQASSHVWCFSSFSASSYFLSLPQVSLSFAASIASKCPQLGLWFCVSIAFCQTSWRSWALFDCFLHDSGLLQLELCCVVCLRPLSLLAGTMARKKEAFCMLLTHLSCVRKQHEQQSSRSLSPSTNGTSTSSSASTERLRHIRPPWQKVVI